MAPGIDMNHLFDRLSRVEFKKESPSIFVGNHRRCEHSHQSSAFNCTTIRVQLPGTDSDRVPHPADLRFEARIHSIWRSPTFWCILSHGGMGPALRYAVQHIINCLISALRSFHTNSFLMSSMNFVSDRIFTSIRPGVVCPHGIMGFV